MFTNSLIAISRPWVSKVIHGIAIMLLTGCLVLNLILLLLPTSSLHLSVFSIEPTGKQLVAKTPTPTNNETITLSPNVSIGAYEGLNKEPVNRTAIVEAPKFWMGIDGPSIWVGAMSICSKRSDKGDVSCTSASRASEHSTSLPFTLSDSLVVMPTSPPVPILLVVGALCLTVALVVYLGNLICRCRAYATFRERSPFNLLRHQPKFSTRNHRHTMMSTDSTITLVNRSSDVSTPRPRYSVSLIAVFALTCGAFGLSLAATVIEMINVQRAKDHWSGEQAVEIGMEWQHGALTFLMPALPAALLLLILISLVPLVGHLNGRESMLGQKIVSAPAPTADAEDVKSVSPLTQVPPGWTRINVERPRSGFRAVGDAEQSTTVRASVIGTAV